MLAVPALLALEGMRSPTLDVSGGMNSFLRLTRRRGPSPCHVRGLPPEGRLGQGLLRHVAHEEVAPHDHDVDHGEEEVGPFSCFTASSSGSARPCGP